MIKKHYLLGFFYLVLSACSTNGTDNEPKKEEKQVDTTPPEISCVADINVGIDYFATNAVVTYTAPIGTDNVAGASTTQTAGLASGATFPVGVTTNTFQVKDVAGNSVSCSFKVTVSKNDPSADLPYLTEVNPAPTSKKWVKVDALSDEFNLNALDEVKWKNTDPSQWIGRAPGLFKKSTVSQNDGNLQLTADILPAPEVVNGNTFTHAGSYITSNTAAQVGYFIECRMKANKTFMSSTFWLINKRNEATGCDARTTELDIQECVGQVTGTASWTLTTDKQMGSNLHSRNTSCPETPVGSVGGNTLLSGKASDEYHVYAAWWKSPTEIQFYLDGKKVRTVAPVANFNLGMYMKMVVETYDWNPTPAGGGMNGTAQDRTTYYDWVRTWKLIDN
ncbi:HYR domain-containing protein [Flavobacterium ovatum]|uniref:HYR domain-containing protein n=1 Tax=Flavobacterium ovatum TaxID=1928857 RepID=UPI00344E83C1